MVIKEATRIYGDITSVRDFRDINMQIRREMGAVRTPEELAELMRRSRYLCALATNLGLKERFGRGIARIVKVTREEAAKTAGRANRVARQHGWESDYRG